MKIRYSPGRALLALLSVFVFSMAKGQQPGAATLGKSRIQVAPTYSYLYSTHGTKFRGFGINLETSLSGHTQLGVGAERIYCPYHYDNGFNLSDLHLVPVYGMIRYHMPGAGRFQPYLKAALGISFMHYHQQKAGTVAPAADVHATGLYTYGGLGTTLALNKRIFLFVDMGLVGYKMSFRALDINPHGVAGKTGVFFAL